MNKTKIATLIILTIISFSIITQILIRKDTPPNIISDEIKTEDKYIDLEYYKEYYNNNDIIGILEIPDIFNILITQSEDNEYYLNHSITKDNDKKGTEFMDCRVDINSKQINIYGHNSKTYNLPFRKLENFKNKEFFNENEYIILKNNTIERKYQIYLFKEVTSDYEHMKVNIDKINLIDHLNKLEENYINKRNIEYNEESNILILQTCSYNTKDSFYIIVAIEI